MRKEQIQRYFRYFNIYLRHLTVSRFINLLKVESRLLFNNSDMTGTFPYFIVIDVSNACNLRCPLCQMGLQNNIKRKNLMSLKNYIKILKSLKKYIFQVFLYNWAEPFLNKEIYRMIAYNTQNNIATSVSTNFNIPVDPDKLIDSGLTHLIISADGVTQDVYSSYRIKGDIQKVFDNLINLVNAKKRRNSKLPSIEWQCLVTKHNENQLKSINDKAKSLGVNEARFSNLNFYSVNNDPSIQDEWLPADKRFRQFAFNPKTLSKKNKIRKPCFWLWRAAIINSDGGITPCCLYDVPNWGDVFEKDVISVWNNRTYQEARNRSKNDPKLKTQDLICDRCAAHFIYK